MYQIDIVTRKGQVTIPAEMRKALAMKVVEWPLSSSMMKCESGVSGASSSAPQAF